MLCRQCEEAAAPNGCTKKGICGKTDELAGKMDYLIGSLIELAASGKQSDEADDLIVDGLFMTLSNTNFDEQRIDDAAKTAQSLLGGPAEVRVNGLLALDTDEDVRSLKELLLFGLKGMAAYYHHARVLGARDRSVTDFMRKALAALPEKKTVDEMLALDMECGSVGASVLGLLDKYNTETFGTPEITKVKTGVRGRPGILITGHDLEDLHQLLEQTRGTGVDVYTHGEMLAAHAYPAFKKYDNLVGNYGGAWYEQKDQFPLFNGPIVATTNCVLIPKDSYADRLFTTGTAGIPGAKNIASADGKKDFSDVIELAKKCAPPTPIDDVELTVGLAHTQVLALADKIIDAVKSGAIKRFVVMAGCDGHFPKRSYYTDMAKNLPDDTVILTAGCAKYRYNKLGLGDIGGIPRVVDAGQCNDCYSLVVIASALADAFKTDINGLPLSFDIAWYEQKAVLVLLVLLSLGVKNIMLGPRLPKFLSPNVTKVLVEQFGIKGISSVPEDMVVLNILPAAQENIKAQ